MQKSSQVQRDTVPCGRHKSISTCRMLELYNQVARSQITSSDYGSLPAAQARVNLDAWNKVIEVYNEAARKGLSLSPGVYYDLMRTAVLVANTGHTESLGFAEHCLLEMSHLGEG